MLFTSGREKSALADMGPKDACFLALICLLGITDAQDKPTPLVIWHGMGKATPLIVWLHVSNLQFVVI